jgi:hypothetical protein
MGGLILERMQWRYVLNLVAKQVPRFLLKPTSRFSPRYLPQR